MRGIKATVALLVAGCLLLSGCMNSVRLDERGVIEAIAIDRTPEGGYAAVMQLWVPSQKQGGNVGAGASALFEAQGSTLTELFTVAAVERGKQPFLGSCRLILIGEDAARAGVGELTDFFNANHQIVPSITLAVTKGAAGEVLRAQEQDSALDADRLLDMIRQGRRAGYAPPSRLMDLVGAMQSPDRAASLALAELTQEAPEPSSSEGSSEEGDTSSTAPKPDKPMPGLRLAGSAVFSDNKLALILDPAQTRGIAWATGEVTSTSISVEDDQLGTVATLTNRQHATITSEQMGDTLVFDIAVRVHANILETALTQGESLDEEQRQYAAALQAREIRREIESAIYATQSHGYDLLMLSQLLRQREPDYFAAHEQALNETFSSCGYNITVNCEIDRSGVRGRLM